MSETNNVRAGFFGVFGGQFVPPILVETVQEVARAYEEAKKDPAFQLEFRRLCLEYAGRPSLLYHAED